MIKDLVPFYQWKSVGEGSNFILDKRHFTPFPVHFLSTYVSIRSHVYYLSLIDHFKVDIKRINYLYLQQVYIRN